MVACAYRNVVASELADLLPVSEHLGVERVPVHITSQRVTAAAVAVKVHTGYKRTVTFIAVENLNRAGHKLERRALINQVASREVRVVRGDVCKSVKALLLVDC